jgi:hypothetical protein
MAPHVPAQKTASCHKLPLTFSGDCRAMRMENGVRMKVQRSWAMGGPGRAVIPEAKACPLHTSIENSFHIATFSISVLA